MLVTSCLLTLLLAVAYLFYSNRLLALLIEYVLRISWWTESQDRVWISLGVCFTHLNPFIDSCVVMKESFQISLLSGRIVIKDLRYYSSNQSFRAVRCSIVWRYWLWRTRNGFLASEKYEDGFKGTSFLKTNSDQALILFYFLATEPAKDSKLPSRFHISLEGVEWHLYNRTSAFNDILSPPNNRTSKDNDGSSIHVFSSRSETDKTNVLCTS